MVALQQNLVATAGAHQLMTELVEARVGVGTEEDDSQQGDESELGDSQFQVSGFEFQSKALSAVSYQLSATPF
jgi:hypothetical protein